MKKGIIIFFGLLFSNFGFAQSNGNEDLKENEFSMGVQIRPRAEYRNGALSPRPDDAKAAAFINNRTRISMWYQREKLSLGLSAQHVGVWGQDPQIDKNGRFMLNEAWANLDMGSGFFAKLGRQSLIYDDERILGGLDWNVSGRFYDALKLGYEGTQDKLHLILAFNQNDERIIGGTYYAPGGQPFKNMQTVWYKHIGSKIFDASFLLMNLGMEAGNLAEPDTKYMQTTGANLSYQPGAFQLKGTFYYQLGKTVADKDVSAFMWAVNAACQINPVWKITIGSDYLSGDDGKDKFKAFNPLYGTHHKFYGTMDYFYASSFINGLNPGLWDNQAGITCKASPKLNLLLNYHYFLTTEDVYNTANEKQNKGLGSEVDFQINWNIMKDVNLSAGYSTMLGTDAMKVVKGGNPSSWQDWGWLSLSINPKVFVSKW
ncbi:MAG: alginate export family protein [Dysgonamonadaceae bacterium]|jgi:hypothetical protein|nr:alginate export family protein [Dysgonamonadaceae bacterium]